MKHLPTKLTCSTLTQWKRYGKIEKDVYDSYISCGNRNCTGTTPCDGCRSAIFASLNRKEINSSWKKFENKVNEIQQKSEQQMYYPLATLSKEKQFIVVNKHDNSEISFHETFDEAKDHASRRLQQDSEYLVLKLAATIRPKPLDAEIDEY